MRTKTSRTTDDINILTDQGIDELGRELKDSGTSEKRKQEIREIFAKMKKHEKTTIAKFSHLERRNGQNRIKAVILLLTPFFLLGCFTFTPKQRAVLIEDVSRQLAVTVGEEVGRQVAKATDGIIETVVEKATEAGLDPAKIEKFATEAAIKAQAKVKEFVTNNAQDLMKKALEKSLPLGKEGGTNWGGLLSTVLGLVGQLGVSSLRGIKA